MTNSMLQRIARYIESGRYGRERNRAPAPEFNSEELAREGYCSQSGQDKWVAETLLPGKTDGVFVDIGAHDGVSFSNTYALEKLGWSGLAVEPIPEIFERLAANRNCALLNACIGDPPGRRRFRRVRGYAEMLSGLVDDCDPRHEARIARETAAQGGEIEEVEVDCVDFATALAGHDILSVDYLSVDVEGAELAILRTIDFDRFDIRVIGVENNYADPGAWRLLTKAGFTLHSRVGADEFYLRK